MSDETPPDVATTDGDAESARQPQHFRGHIEGYYVGYPSSDPQVSAHGTASRFKLKIYRATVRDVELVDPVDDDDQPESALYQVEIEDTRLFGVRPRRAFSGSVYDAMVTDMEFTHGTTKGKKVYGRVVGRVHGRILLPEERKLVEAREVEASSEPRAPGSEDALVDQDAADHAAAAAAAAADEPAPDIDALEQPENARMPREEPAPIQVPFLFVTAVIAIVLGLSGGWRASAVWLGLLVPIGFIRLALGGMFETKDVHRAIGAVIIFLQYACLGMLGLKWYTLGCLSVELLPFSGIMATLIAAALLPTRTALLGTSLGLAATLFVWFGDYAVHCDAPEVEAPDGSRSPSVKHPGKPRTNDDGSWPRRPGTP